MPDGLRHADSPGVNAMSLGRPSLRHADRPQAGSPGLRHADRPQAGPPAYAMPTARAPMLCRQVGLAYAMPTGPKPGPRLGACRGIRRIHLRSNMSVCEQAHTANSAQMCMAQSSRKNFAGKKGI